MINIYHHIGEGFKIAGNVKNFYPKKAKKKETEFDVKTAKWSQQASQVAAFVGMFSSIKRLTKSTELMFSSLLEEANGMISRIEILIKTSEWCDGELGTLVKASKADFDIIATNKTSQAYKYETEHGLFTRDTMPTGYREQYAKCKNIPDLDLLDDDPLNDEGQLVESGIQSYKQKYSDPYGIYYKWIASQNRKANRAIQKKKDKKKGKKKAVRFEPTKIQKSVAKVDLNRSKYKFVGDVRKKKNRQSVRKSVAMKKRKRTKSKLIKKEKNKPRTSSPLVKQSGGNDKDSKKLDGEEAEAEGEGEEEVNNEEGEEEGEWYGEEEGEELGEDWEELGEDDEDSDDAAPPPPPPPGAPPMLEFKFSGNSTGGSIFGAIAKGGFKLRKVTDEDKEKPKTEFTEREGLLDSIRSFRSTKLKSVEKRELPPKKSANKRAPLNVAEILQQQMSMISQAGNDDDEADSDDDWDDEDSEEDEW